MSLDREVNLLRDFDAQTDFLKNKYGSEVILERSNISDNTYFVFKFEGGELRRVAYGSFQEVSFTKVSTSPDSPKEKQRKVIFMVEEVPSEKSKYSWVRDLLTGGFLT